MKATRWFLITAAALMLGMPDCSLLTTPVAVVSVLGEAQYADDFATTGRFTLATVPIGLDSSVVQLSDPSSVTIEIDSTVPPSQHYTVSVSGIQFTNPLSGNQAFAVIFDGGTAMAMSDPYRNRVRDAENFVRFIGQWNPNDEVSIADLGDGADSEYYLRLLQGFVPATETLPLFAAIDQVTDTGRTPLYTSLVRYLAYTDTSAIAAQFSRKLVVFVAGRDTTSQPDDNLAAVIASATAKNIPVNIIGIGSGVDNDALGELASATHGFYIHSSNLDAAISSLGNGFSKGYDVVTASFSPIPPSGTVGDGRVSINSTGSASTTLRVRIP